VLADEGYAVFRKAARVGRPNMRSSRKWSFLPLARLPENFQILGSGGREVRGMHPPTERRLAPRPGDDRADSVRDGYYAQICRTLVLGEPSEAQTASSLYTTRRSKRASPRTPGATAGDVARAQNEVFRNHGLATM